MALNLNRQPLDLILNTERRQTGAQRVILQCRRRAKHRHDPVAGELVHRAAVTAAPPPSQRSTSSVMISRSGSGPTAAAMSIECTTSANKHRHLLVLSRPGRLRESRTALAAELSRRAGLRAAGTADQPRRGQSTATVPAGAHVSIVSLMVNNVRSYHRCHLRHEVHPQAAGSSTAAS